jgi:hypothetical protein
MLLGEHEKRELENVFHKPYPYRIDEDEPSKKYKPMRSRG